MKVIKPYYVIETPIDGDEILKSIEKAGRTCYKSEHKITADSAMKFVSMIAKRGHESVLEHRSFSVRFVCDRGVTHELVRHRLAAYSQESTRFCCYAKERFDSEITFIKPCFWKEDSAKYMIWHDTMLVLEQVYMDMIQRGATPQEARSVLPNSLKTEIVMTANLREWKHVFKMRCSKYAHPQMREVMVPLLFEIQSKIPVIYDDIEFKELKDGK
jgi:thymidylate synthase (FAD)